MTQRLSYEQERSRKIARKLGTIELEKAALVKAVALIDKAIALISQHGVETIESIVSGGLQLAFEDPTLGFTVVKTEGKRGNSYSLLVRRGDVSGPVMETFGGGIWNVAAFLLRVIMIKRFKLARVLIADEVFNNVSPVNQPRLSHVLRDLTRNHGYTILAVTHSPILAIAADNVYRVVPRPRGTIDGKYFPTPPLLVKLDRDGLLEAIREIFIETAE